MTEFVTDVSAYWQEGDVQLGSVTYAKAIFDYVASSETDLGFNTGDSITVLRKVSIPRNIPISIPATLAASQ